MEGFHYFHLLFDDNITYQAQDQCAKEKTREVWDENNSFTKFQNLRIERGP